MTKVVTRAAALTGERRAAERDDLSERTARRTGAVVARLLARLLRRR
jgi:hypothetical protein